LMHKLRESLMVQREESPLRGEVDMDGAYVGGHVRPKNKQEDRVDRRLAENQNPDKRCILVLREKHPQNGDQPGPVGARRTLSFVIRRENQADVGALASRFIAPGTVISADESDAYDLLHAQFPMRRVNHQQAYRADDGTTNNQAESYFSRFRRMEIGQTHQFGLRYLANYANEAAYREDTRRQTNGEIFRDILLKCLDTRTHRDWCGYWQGNKRLQERLAG
jgi:hypothetical protein